jgi:hypothetical protein
MGFEQIGAEPMDGPGSARWIEARAPSGTVDPGLYATHVYPDQVGRLGAVLLHLR